MHESYLRRAIKRAKEWRDSLEGGPFGAIIVRDSEVICEVHNLVMGKDDLTHHAEPQAIQVARGIIGRDNLKGERTQTLAFLPK